MVICPVAETRSQTRIARRAAMRDAGSPIACSERWRDEPACKITWLREDEGRTEDQNQKGVEKRNTTLSSKKMVVGHDFKGYSIYIVP